VRADSVHEQEIGDAQVSTPNYNEMVRRSNMAGRVIFEEACFQVFFDSEMMTVGLNGTSITNSGTVIFQGGLMVASKAEYREYVRTTAWDVDMFSIDAPEGISLVSDDDGAGADCDVLIQAGHWASNPKLGNPSDCRDYVDILAYDMMHLYVESASGKIKMDLARGGDLSINVGDGFYDGTNITNSGTVIFRGGLMVASDAAYRAYIKAIDD
jgi:hypothetical protein